MTTFANKIRPFITFPCRISQKFGNIGNYLYFYNVIKYKEDGNRKNLIASLAG